MNVLRWTMPLVLLSVLTGCHGKSGADDLVVRDLRLQEDRIYELENYINQYQAMLSSAQRENDTLRKALENNEDVTAPARTGADELIPRTGGGAPGGALTPPDVDPGTSTDPGGLLVPPTVDPGTPLDNAPPADSDSEPVPPGLVPPDFESRNGGVGKGTPARLVLNKRLTGGLNSDGKPGDDGILVVIEPRDARDQLVRVPGEVSLLVVDSTRTGAESHIARWDFTATEAQAAWRKTLLGHGMHFSLLWPNRPPKVDQLRLYARVIQPNGRKMLAELDFSVDLAARRPSTNPTTDRSAPAANQWVESEVRIPDDPQPLRQDIETRPRRHERRVTAEHTRHRQSEDRQDVLRDEPHRDAAASREDAPRTARPTWEPYR